jgi:Domain of unknown function (DUF4411)
VLYLLDADTLIRADNTYYPMNRFPVFWDWLLYNGSIETLKIPQEQYDEVIAGRGELVDWLKARETKESILLPGVVDSGLLTRVIKEGYAENLDEAEQLAVGQDPFLIAYALVAAADRTVVSFEVSAPAKQRANRKVPDVCAGFGIRCITLFELIRVLDFSTNWTRP